jgi:hypothetical protein
MVIMNLVIFVGRTKDYRTLIEEIAIIILDITYRIYYFCMVIKAKFKREFKQVKK